MSASYEDAKGPGVRRHCLSSRHACLRAPCSRRAGVHAASRCRWGLATTPPARSSLSRRPTSPRWSGCSGAPVRHAGHCRRACVPWSSTLGNAAYACGQALSKGHWRGGGPTACPGPIWCRPPSLPAPRPLASARSIPARSHPAARVLGGSRASATLTLPSAQSLCQPRAPGRRTHSIAPASKPIAPVLRRGAPSGRAQPGGRGGWSVAEATGGGRGVLGAPAPCRAPRALGGPPPRAGTSAHISPGSRSRPWSVSGASPRSPPPPSRGRWRRRRVSSRTGRTASGCGTSAERGRRRKRHGRPATPA